MGCQVGRMVLGGGPWGRGGGVEEGEGGGAGDQPPGFLPEPDPCRLSPGSSQVATESQDRQVAARGTRLREHPRPLLTGSGRDGPTAARGRGAEAQKAEQCLCSPYVGSWSWSSLGSTPRPSVDSPQS